MKLYYNCKILTCTGEDFENGYILVDNGKIAAVGDMKNMPQCAQSCDLEGATVCPGFVDAHSHIGIFGDSVGYEGADGNEQTDPVTPQMRAIDGINPQDICFGEALAAGVTTVAVGPGSANPIGGTFVVMKTAGKRIDKMVIKDDAAMKMAFGENPKKCHGKDGKMPRTRMGTAALIRDALYRAKEYDGKNFDIKCAALKPVADGSMLVKAHAHRADDVFTALRIAKEFGLKMTIEHCTDGALIADELRSDNVFVCFGPIFGDRSKPELRNKSYDTMTALHSAGVSFALITDHPEIPQCELLACAQVAAKHGIPRECALRAITINGAKAVGVQDRVGSIEPGKDADFCVFSAHPIDFSSRLLSVFCNGEKVES